MVVHDIFTVMEKDSLETSHPVSTYVEDPNQVQQYFDEISYEKVNLIKKIPSNRKLIIIKFLVVFVILKGSKCPANASRFHRRR